MTTVDRTPRTFTRPGRSIAPAETVFRAWTDPDHLDWFYNHDQPKLSQPIELDLRVGGAWRQHMVIDEATSYATGGIYREIVPAEKLVFAWGAPDGWPTLDPEHLDDSPQVTMTLERVDGRTEMTVHVELPAHLSEASVQERWPVSIRDGWLDTVDRLARALADTPTITAAR
jgi:uncharacterized protein YndB with AHSA1/START domain